MDLRRVIDPDNGETVGVYTRGHVDILAFGDECRREGYPEAVQVPEHEWWRAIPYREPGERYYRTIFRRAAPGRKGAFPVTHATLQSWER